MLQLQRISDGVVFDVLGTEVSGRGSLRSDGTGTKNPDGHVVWMRYAVGTQLNADHGGIPYGFGNHYLRDNFTAYPPQEKPDRVDQLTQETDDWEPLVAYRKAYCPADRKELEDGYRVAEAYAGALIDALFCGTCNRHYSADTLTEIKLWKD